MFVKEILNSHSWILTKVNFFYKNKGVLQKQESGTLDVVITDASDKSVCNPESKAVDFYKKYNISNFSIG